MKFRPVFFFMIAALSVAQRCATHDALLSSPAAATLLLAPPVP